MQQFFLKPKYLLLRTVDRRRAVDQHVVAGFDQFSELFNGRRQGISQRLGSVVLDGTAVVMDAGFPPRSGHLLGRFGRQVFVGLKAEDTGDPDLRNPRLVLGSDKFADGKLRFDQGIPPEHGPGPRGALPTRRARRSL